MFGSGEVAIVDVETKMDVFSRGGTEERESKSEVESEKERTQ